MILLVFRAETQDGGDARVAVTPRDIIYTQHVEPLEGEEPEILHKLDLRYGYVYEIFVTLRFFCIVISR